MTYAPPARRASAEEREKCFKQKIPYRTGDETSIENGHHLTPPTPPSTLQIEPEPPDLKTETTSTELHPCQRRGYRDEQRDGREEQRKKKTQPELRRPSKGTQRSLRKEVFFYIKFLERNEMIFRERSDFDIVLLYCQYKIILGKHFIVTNSTPKGFISRKSRRIYLRGIVSPRQHNIEHATTASRL